MDKSLKIDVFIKKLLLVSGKKNMTVKLKEKEMMALCGKVKQIFSE